MWRWWLSHVTGRSAHHNSRKLPIKIVVFNNSSLNFVELEQKVEGLLDHYTDLLNPDFGQLARVIGLHGQTITHGNGLEQAVESF